VAKPTLERKPKPVPKTRKTVELSAPTSKPATAPAAPVLEPFKAPQSLPKTSAEAIPQLQPLKAPEPVKTVPEAPTIPSLIPVSRKNEEAIKAAAVEVKAMAPAEPPAPPPLIKLQKGGTPNAYTPPALEKIIKPGTVKSEVPGIPPLERVVRTAKAPEPAAAASPETVASNEVVERVVRKVEVIENVIRQDEMFVVYGVSDGEFDFRGLYTRAHLGKLSEGNETDKLVKLLQSIYNEDIKDRSFDRAWVKRVSEGHISQHLRRGEPNPYAKAVIVMDLKDDDRGRSHAVWASDEDRASEPYIVYKYMVFKTDMNCRAPRIPLHLL
jgi:hypothetical protein